MNKKIFILLAEDGSPFLVLIASYISENVLENVLEGLCYVLEHTAEEQSSWRVVSSVNRNRYSVPGMMHLLQQLKW